MPKEVEAVPIWEKAALTVEETIALTGFGRDTVRALTFAGGDCRARERDGGCAEAWPSEEDEVVGRRCIMTGKRIRRMVGWRHGNIAVLHVQYTDGTVEDHIFEGGEPYENSMEPLALD